MSQGFWPGCCFIGTDVFEREKQRVFCPDGCDMVGLVSCHQSGRSLQKTVVSADAPPSKRNDSATIIHSFSHLSASMNNYARLLDEYISAGVYSSVTILD